MSKLSELTKIKGRGLSHYEKELLVGWEEVYKKGHLTLWILLALKHGAKHMAEIKRFINAHTDGTLSADDKSMYRSLRRYEKADLVSFKTRASKNGPDLKIYQLTDTGKTVLDNFIKRNIIPIFFTKRVKELLQ